MSRVLFVHVRKQAPEVAMPHLGLASLAAVLQQASHEVVVFDEVLYPLGHVPPLEDIIALARPDVIGFTSYTSTLDRLQTHLAAVRAAVRAPIMVGGPHASLFAQDMVGAGNVDYVVRGEAEGVIVGLVEEARRQSAPVVVQADPPDVENLPRPCYDAFLNAQRMDTYPILTSRGCPYRCSFCGVHRVSSHRWRPRRPADCVAEIRETVPRFPQVRSINVSDDCPTGRPANFKEFLRLLAAESVHLPLQVDNMRADLADAELMSLLRAAGAGMVCLGVESGNPEVFALVNKGETHEDIRNAARLATEAGLQLGLCFVIGLPGDNPRRHQDSIRFARELSPNIVFWNIAHPFPGTEMHRWFSEHDAEMDPPRSYTSYDSHSLVCAEPTVSTPDFTKQQRRRAYFQAVVETDQYVLTPATPWHLLSGGVRYGLLGPAARSFSRRVARLLKRTLRRFRPANDEKRDA